MKCPYCGKASDVTDSRIREDGTVRRRRFCLNEHKFTTTEMSVETVDGLRAEIYREVIADITKELARVGARIGFKNYERTMRRAATKLTQTD